MRRSLQRGVEPARRGLRFTGMKSGLLSFMFAGIASAQWIYVAPPLPPPPPAYGYAVYGRAPGPGFVWRGGYWDWRDRYVWVPGAWVRAPRGHQRWAAPGWVKHGRGYKWNRGRWCR